MLLWPHNTRSGVRALYCLVPCVVMSEGLGPVALLFFHYANLCSDVFPVVSVHVALPFIAQCTAQGAGQPTSGERAGVCPPPQKTDRPSPPLHRCYASQ